MDILNPPLGLRFKLVFLSCFLFAIPWLGWEYVWEMEKFLRAGQEKTLSGTVSAVATALHERPSLFDENATLINAEEWLVQADYFSLKDASLAVPNDRIKNLLKLPPPLQKRHLPH